jgi:hypothetical protein
LLDQGFEIVGTFGSFSSSTPWRSLEILAKKRSDPDQTTYPILLQKGGEAFFCHVVVSNVFWEGVEQDNEVVMKLDKPSSYCFSSKLTN